MIKGAKLKFRLIVMVAAMVGVLGGANVVLAAAPSSPFDSHINACEPDVDDCGEDGDSSADTPPPTMTEAYGKAFIRLAWGYHHTATTGISGAKLKLSTCKQKSTLAHSCKVSYRMTQTRKGKAKRTGVCTGTISASYVGTMDTFDQRIASFKGSCTKPRRKHTWSADDCWNATLGEYQRKTPVLAGAECVPEGDGRDESGAPVGDDDTPVEEPA